LAIVWTQPKDSVHHDTIKLVSLNFRFRRRIASELSTRPKSTTRNGLDFAIRDHASHDD
jgi:hypothetical protein